MSNIQAQVAQVTPVVVGEADRAAPKMTKLGALYSADWKFQLAAAGMVYSAVSASSSGALTAGADVVLIVGGGNGTTVDSDQPELIIGVDAGYYLIPISINAGLDMDCDADGEYGQFVAFIDRTSAPPTTNASGTVVTPTNNLDGGAAFPGRCWSASTGDITDPVLAELLVFKYFNTADNGTAASALPQNLDVSWEAKTPKVIAGPCSLVVCWGGTAAVNGLATVEVAAVPAAYFPVS